MLGVIHWTDRHRATHKEATLLCDPMAAFIAVVHHVEALSAVQKHTDHVVHSLCRLPASDTAYSPESCLSDGLLIYWLSGSVRVLPRCHNIYPPTTACPYPTPHSHTRLFGSRPWDMRLQKSNGNGEFAHGRFVTIQPARCASRSSPHLGKGQLRQISALQSEYLHTRY
jgi:hypothetical protein